MNRAVLLSSLFLLLAATPALGTDRSTKHVEYLLETAGYAIDNASLRVLVRNVAAPDKDRLLALDLLEVRHVTEVTEDIELLLREDQPQSLLIRMTSTLLFFDARRYEATAVETAARIETVDKKLSIASKLASHGSPALYPVLLEALEAKGSWTRYQAVHALAALAITSWSPLEPNPFDVLVSRALSPKSPGGFFEEGEISTRKEVVWQLAKVLCKDASPPRWAVGLRTIRGMAKHDPAAEALEVARKAANALAAGRLLNDWPIECYFSRQITEHSWGSRGLSEEAAAVRGYLASHTQREEIRVMAAETLAGRGDLEAVPAFEAALRADLSAKGLARIAHALLELGGSRAAPAVVAAASRSQSRELKLYLAQDLAHHGEAELYPVLVESLKGEGEIARHVALAGIASLSRLPTAATLDPDPVKVLIETLAAGASGLRLEAAEALGEASFAGADEPRRVLSLRALQAAAADDSALEVRAAASEAVTALSASGKGEESKAPTPPQSTSHKP